MSTRDSIREELEAAAAQGLRRQIPPITRWEGPLVTVHGRPAVNFSANDYLGLADHPALRATVASALAHERFGAGGARLIAGDLPAHGEVEGAVAAWLRCEAALLYNSGYQANLGTIGALVGPGDGIFSDALNHASIIDGARLSRAAIQVYPHRDLATLARHLAAAAGLRRRLIVTDSLFSMDGDVAPLADLADLARRHDALLLVDEAHALGASGEEGRGFTAGLPIDLRLGTFGKALGGFGAFIAGDRLLIELLVQRARAFVFSTALPSPVSRWAAAALALVRSPEGEARRRHLAALTRRFRTGLRALDLPVAVEGTYIIPLIVGAPEATMALSRELLARGIYVHGIRPPTVPPGTARLRFSLLASHVEAHVDAALEALRALRQLLP